MAGCGSPAKGNPNGRPVGTRQAFSAGFYRDLAEVFAKHGRAAMEKTAQDQPSVFFGICARLLPNDVRVTVEQSLPGNLSMDDWQLPTQPSTDNKQCENSEIAWPMFITMSDQMFEI